MIARLRGKLAHEPGANLFLHAGAGHPHRRPPDATRSTSTRCRPTTSPSCAPGSRKIRAALSHLPELVDVNTDQQDKGLQTSLVIDRDAASRLGVTARMIDTTLNDAFGQRQVSTIYNAAQPVPRGDGSGAAILAVARDAEATCTCSTADGAQVPLSAFATLRPDQHAARR